MGVQIMGNQDPERNKPCPCGSGLKFKWCHGDPLKVAVCNRVANEKMVQLIFQEKKKRGLIEPRYKCNNCGTKFDEPQKGEIVEYVCPNCKSVNFEEVN